MNDTAREEMILKMVRAAYGEMGYAIIGHSELTKGMRAALSVLQPRLDAAEGMRDALLGLRSDDRERWGYNATLISEEETIKADKALADYDAALKPEPK